ncbi:hypothetical protein [Bosea sp. NPDC055594]
MTFSVSQVAKVFIFAAKMARERAALAAWVEGHRTSIDNLLPGQLAADVLNEARTHYRGLPR